MPFTVRLAHQKKSFIVEENETILDAALRQNFDIPHSCCEGICGSCEVQLIEGKVNYAHPDQLILDEAERASGRALLCCAKAQSDLLIHAPECTPPLHVSHHNFEYQLVNMRPLTDEIWQVCCKPTQENAPLAYLAGQYILVECVPEEELKPFSIANAPTSDHLLELHVRCQKDNIFAHHLISTLQQSGTLKFQGSFGNAFYHPTPLMPSILLAIGTGFAPIKAILEEAFKKPLEHEMRLFWAGKSPKDLYQLDLVQQWADHIPHFSITPLLASANTNLSWPYEYGNIIQAVCDAYPTLADHHIYFGGPMQLTLDGLEQFIVRGAETSYIYSDVFDML